MYEIYSIERVSDNETFSIGDCVQSISGNWKGFSTYIEEIIPANDKITFKIKDTTDVNRFGVCYGSYTSEISNWRKGKQTLFTTEDGIEIFKENHPALYWVEKFSFEKGIDHANYLNERVNKLSYKYFVTEKACNNWILMNKPCLSLNDVKNISSVVGFNSFDERITFYDLLRKLVESKHEG